MPESVVVSFGHVHGARAREVTGALATVLSLVRDDLEGCEAGFRRDSQGLLAVVRLDAPKPAAAVARLAFWCARAGGVALSLSQATASTRANVVDALGASDARVSLGQDRVAEGVTVLAAAAGLDEPVEPPGPLPVLVLSLGGPGWEAMTYDPARRRLFVPSPLSPPLGDRFVLRLEGAPGEEFTCSGTVRTVAVGDPYQPRDAAPAGFVVAVEEGRGLHACLAEACPPRADGGRRSAPRLRVGGRTRLTTPASAVEARFEDVSHGGAFVSTDAPVVPGTPIRLDLSTPHGERLGLAATVVHGRAGGVGVEFGAGRAARAVLDAAVTGLTAARPRALVVDDDALARAMLSEALAGRGFEVVTERDAMAGLLRLAEEIFSLDVLVTDVVMPEVDGGELVRRIRHVGGERDLPIVAVTGSEDPALAARLRASGADEVLAKRIGPDGIADAVVKLHRDVRAGRAGSPEPARACR
ncbi:response regulator receiver modulated PilZ sensor protein [Anaeromyxobacter sp. K]|uniref:response regulator n=1 Tax=Anaeromyxobacter sp. (strain K) TaxID=447217 RepID=UPI00015F9E1D|nr:response regulator [Anaeromyxobacter sp. K]ACG74461.1 response regulator receiver modulated PilZ sensor protein [Anaeromyxobacter sp. K]